MAPSGFQQLCDDFCDLARMPSPQLSPDGEGIMAFHLEWHGVVVDVMHFPPIAPDHLVVLFDLGPANHEEGAERRITQALLRANFLSLPGRTPTFAFHPVTDAAVMQCIYPLCGTPTGLYRLIDDNAGLALQWRRQFFLQEAGLTSSALPSGGSLR